MRRLDGRRTSNGKQELSSAQLKAATQSRSRSEEDLEFELMELAVGHGPRATHARGRPIIAARVDLYGHACSGQLALAADGLEGS